MNARFCANKVLQVSKPKKSVGLGAGHHPCIKDRWAIPRIVELYKDGAPDTAQAPVKHIALGWKPARSCWKRTKKM